MDGGTALWYLCSNVKLLVRLRCPAFTKLIATLTGTFFFLTQLSKSLPTCILGSNAQTKTIDFACSLMFTLPLEQHPMHSRFSVHFNIFQWLSVWMTIFFSYVSLWGIRCKSKHIQGKEYLHTSSEGERRGEYSRLAPLLHLYKEHSGRGRLKSQRSTALPTRERAGVINLCLRNMLNTSGSDYCCASSHSHVNICTCKTSAPWHILKWLHGKMRQTDSATGVGSQHGERQFFVNVTARSRCGKHAEARI